MMHFCVDVMSNKSTEFFLSLFDKTPELRVLVFYRNNKYFLDILQESLSSTNPRIKAVELTDDFAQKTLKLTPRAYEYVVLVDILDGTNSEYLKELYHSLENSAHIIVLSKKSNLIDAYYIKELLDSNDFRAANEIDIFDDYYLVTAKKLHMWGAGL